MVTGPAGGPAGVRFEPLSVDRHLDLLHGWIHTAHVEPWWGVHGGIDATRAYVAEVAAMKHQRAWIARDADGPFGYVETYVVAEDALAEHYAADPGDRGLHLFVGPAERLGTEATRQLAVAVLAGLLGEAAATRVVCEPNVRNLRMRRFCAGLGAEQLDEFVFGPKTAALLAWPREVVTERWPEAIVDAERAGRRWDAMEGTTR